MPTPLDTVYEFGGEIIKDFRQGDQSSYGWINLDPKTRGGACLALSCWWMVKDKKKEEYWNWITKPSGIKEINKMQTGKIYSKFDAVYDYAVKMMKSNGLKIVAEGTAEIKPFDVQRVAMECYQNPGYKLIQFWGPAGGHAVAAHVTEVETHFFDPNYGLVWFDKRLQFAYWMVRFWQKADFYRMNLGEKAALVTAV
jgi:hypothetical protein